MKAAQVYINQYKAIDQYNRIDQQNAPEARAAKQQPEPRISVCAMPTLQEILDLPAFRGAEVISGMAQMEMPVTWVHSAEILDVGRFLSGGELLLSTGMELQRVSRSAQVQYLQSLVRAGTRALGLELVQWITEVPQALLEAAEQANFPIIVFRSEVSFRNLTRSAHELILRPVKHASNESALETVLSALTETGRDKQFLERTLGPLLRLPQRPRCTLLATLEMLLETQFNISAAAKKLGVRRQSVYYRLEQLTGLLGPLDLQEHRSSLQIALGVLHATPAAPAEEKPGKGIVASPLSRRTSA